MNNVLKFIRTNIIVLISIVVCMIAAAFSAADKTNRQRGYVSRLSYYLTYIADEIEYITSRKPDNIDSAAFRVMGESLITVHAMQNDGRYFVDHKLASTDCFEFIYWVIYTGMGGKEAFISDNVLSEDETAFLNMLRSDLNSLADELSRCEKRGIFVDIKAVNRLLYEFNEKYGMGHKAIETYKSIFPQF